MPPHGLLPADIPRYRGWHLTKEINMIDDGAMGLYIAVAIAAPLVAVAVTLMFCRCHRDKE